MEIAVCIKRVPDPVQNEIQIDDVGNDIRRDDLVFAINEWDNYAVEEAIQIVDRVGGTVTVVTVGAEEDQEVVRRAMAMGAAHGVLISDDLFGGSDGLGIATILKSFFLTRNFDLILTGVQAEAGEAQVGGMLAALLDYPFASLVNCIEILDGDKLKVTREVEGGNRELNEIDLPCVLSVQTGINSPRYVGIRAVRKMAATSIPILNGSDLSIDGSTVGEAAAKVKRMGYFASPSGKGAEMLQGSTEEIVDQLIDSLRTKGALK